MRRQALARGREERFVVGWTMIVRKIERRCNAMLPSYDS